MGHRVSPGTQLDWLVSALCGKLDCHRQRGNSQNSWKTSGGSPGGQLAFRVDINNTLHIGRFTAGQTDPQGIMVTPSNGGKSFTTAVAEIAFPNIPPADSNSNSIVSPNPPLTTTITNTTGNFFLAPGDSTVTTTCSWDFTTLLSREPGTLSKPGEIGKTATPATRERVGAPPKEDKPTPGSIRPPVPAALSIFFGGPGGGSVAEAIFSVTKLFAFLTAP
jgi:hypothetical protein